MINFKFCPYFCFTFNTTEYKKQIYSKLFQLFQKWCQGCKNTGARFYQERFHLNTRPCFSNWRCHLNKECILWFYITCIQDSLFNRLTQLTDKNSKSQEITILHVNNWQIINIYILVTWRVETILHHGNFNYFYFSWGPFY